MEVKVYNFINLDYLDMMSDGDLEMKKVMLDMLFDELPTEIAKMRELVNSGRWKELSSVAHKMKSTLSFIGCDTMTAANIDIETSCKYGEGNFSIISTNMEILESNLENVISELKIEHSKL
jgi:HPt (histidine-containing phosphotransfer) domain-containing protein